MKRFSIAAGFLSLLQASLSFAGTASFSYDTFSLQFGKTDVQGSADDLSTTGVFASLSINDDIFGFVGHNRYQGKVLGLDSTIGRTDVGLGLVFPIKKELDLVVSAALVRMDSEFCDSGCFSAKDSGYNLGLKANYWLTTKIDALTSINFTELDDAGSDTIYDFGLGYWPSKEHRLGLSYQTGTLASESYDSIWFNYRISQNLE